MKLIDGKAVSQKIKEDLKLRIDQIKQREKECQGLPWCLGENPRRLCREQNKRLRASRHKIDTLPFARAYREGGID